MHHFILLSVLLMLANTVMGQSIENKEVRIGNKIWAAENLDVKTYRNGDIIPQIKNPKLWSKTTEGAWCYYKNKKSNGKKYGILYNWYAVNDPRGLAPEGWRVASAEDWDSLLMHFQTEEYYSMGLEVGNFLKSTVGWEENRNGKNLSGFNALPAGCMTGEGKFFNLGRAAYFWTSVHEDGINFECISLYYLHNAVDRNFISETNGFSVRCVRE